MPQNLNDCTRENKMSPEPLSSYFIIVIDDDPVMRLSCFKILDKIGYQVETFEDGIQGLERIQEKKPDLLVVDLKMPKIGGMEVISRVHKIDPDICIVVITGYATIGTAVEAMKTGAYDFLPKPFTPDELRLIVNRGIERNELAKRSKQLKEEKENLERRFITFVSHQLQSPLVAVQQYLEVLNHLDDSPQTREMQREWINRSLTRIKELQAIVRDWLTISKIESGNFVECKGSVSLKPMIEDILTTYKMLADENNINLISELPDNLSQVFGSDECLKMLFANLVHNAIKYNKKGEAVKITIFEKKNKIYIEIADNGIGIPQDKLELIFEDFYRIKNDSTKNISGTGLGLPICKKIVSEISGEMEVQSTINQGTTFRVILSKYED